jgi:N4-(beta-N-acetylglucosaminyl)-L-asparaginase
MTRELLANWTRRRFLQSSAGAVAAGALARASVAQEKINHDGARPGFQPIVISSANGLKAIDKAMEQLRAGRDPLDAVIAAVNIVEDDPNDHSVGLGGLPNEDGVVELDASVMYGPTHKAGAVASIRNIKNPSKVARLVMERTDHVLLVGEGALRFAKAHGFKEENLLTDEAREMWLKWKESLSKEDDWLSPEEAGATTRPAAGALGREVVEHTWGTINCCAVDVNGNLAGTTTTSGLSYKIPGRVGDSPIIGAGLYVDNAVGAAGSTGRGEANLQNCTSFLIVELMRAGHSPEDACFTAMQRVADHTEPRLRRKDGKPGFDLKLYALAKDGRYGGATMWSGGKFAVHDGTTAKLVDCAPLYKKA